MTALKGTPLEKLHALYGEWGHGDISRSDIFDPDVESTSFGMWPEGDTSIEGLEELSSVMTGWLRTWRDPLTITAEDFIQSGDRILALVRWKGIGRGSGVEVEAVGAHLWTFRDGLAVRFDVYRNRDEARAALEQPPPDG